MTDDFDFSVFEQIPVDKTEDASIENLVKHATEMSELKETIESIEGTLSELQKQYNYIAQEVIPEMLDELGLKTFELKDGSKITVKDFISGSLPKDEQRFAQAVEWLKDNDLEAILKTNVSLTFGKGEANMATNAIELLKEQGYEPDSKYSAHPQTLYSAIRELMKEGHVIPFEMLGLYAGKKADIKLKK
jgi:hypothetical protein